MESNDRAGNIIKPLFFCPALDMGYRKAPLAWKDYKISALLLLVWDIERLHWPENIVKTLLFYCFALDIKRDNWAANIVKPLLFYCSNKEGLKILQNLFSSFVCMRYKQDHWTKKIVKPLLSVVHMEYQKVSTGWEHCKISALLLFAWGKRKRLLTWKNRQTSLLLLLPWVIKRDHWPENIVKPLLFSCSHEYKEIIDLKTL